MKTKSRESLKLIVQVLFVSTAFFFLVRILYLNWQRLKLDFSQISYLPFLFSFLLFLGGLVGYAFSWWLVLKKLDGKMSLSKAIKVWYWSQIARYIPGSLWQIVGRVYLGAKEGISRGKILLSIAIETSFLIISSFLIFLSTLPFWAIKLARFKVFWPYFAFGFLFLIFLHPGILNRITQFFLLKIDKKVATKTNLKAKDAFQMLGAYVLVWLVFGTAFYLLVSSFKQVNLSYLPLFIGLFSISWMLGFLFVIAPGGLGVREGVMATFLSLYLPLPLAVTLSILSRILMIIAEVLILVVSRRF